MPNGVFGDPLVHVRISHVKRSLLIDFGEGERLPARIAHQVTDVLISHAHADHITGFLSFVRSRIGKWPVCRVFGPPGIAENVAGLVSGIHWDRAGARGPRFEVTELVGNRLKRFGVAAGRREPDPLGDSETDGGLLFTDELLEIRAVELDHLTPVLAFSLEPRATQHVRGDRLAALGLAPGPWLTALKCRAAAGDPGALIELPNGESREAAALARELLIVEPPQKLVYATDLADTPGNRDRLTRLASGAYAFFLEAAFAEADSDHAERTGHLETRACAEIAAAAGVERLIPFHFSRRYEKDVGRIYDEIARVFPRVMRPPDLAARSPPGYVSIRMAGTSARLKANRSSRRENAMADRDDFIERFKRKLGEWNVEIDQLEERARKAGSDVRSQTTRLLGELRRKSDAIDNDLKELGRSMGEAWHDLGEGLDEAGEDLRAAITDAKNRFTHDEPDEGGTGA